MSSGSILMVISNYRALGGHQTVINNLCNGLYKIGYNIAIGAFSFDQNPPDNIEKVNLKKFRSLESNKDTSKYNFDIIHSHQTQMNYYSFLTRKPFIFHYYGASNRIQKINLKVSAFLCRKRISKIIGLSNAALNDLRKIVGESISSKIPSGIIYCGVDTTYYHTGLPKPYKKGDPQLLFVGNLYPHKNVITIIKGMPEIIKFYPDAHLQIVGNGSEYQKLENEIKKEKLEHRIELVGSVSNEDLRLRYSSCDIYVSASKWEMFDLPPIEAMACGKPALLSDIPVHREIFEPSNAGRLYSLSDDSNICSALREVYENRQFLSSSARGFAEKYDWSMICNEMGKVYETMIA
jgi:glycosyltransferase involved in cell wall biosynthesis